VKSLPFRGHLFHPPDIVEKRLTGFLARTSLGFSDVGCHFRIIHLFRFRRASLILCFFHPGLQKTTQVSQLIGIGGVVREVVDLMRIVVNAGLDRFSEVFSFIRCEYCRQNVAFGIIFLFGSPLIAQTAPPGQNSEETTEPEGGKKINPELASAQGALIAFLKGIDAA